MAHRVGKKGQLVIEKPIRDALGVEPGSMAVQERVGDKVVIRFLPAEHERSLRGALRPRPGTSRPKDWETLRAEGWRQATVRRWQEDSNEP